MGQPLVTGGEVKKELGLDFPVRTYGRLLSVQNGYLIFVREVDANDKQAWVVTVVEPTGRNVVFLDVLNQLEGATDVSIHDVSVGKSGLIAVAAVAVRSRQERPVALLLVYSPEGRLLNAQRVDSHMELTKIRIDEDDSIWGLGNGAGDRDPDQVSMFLRFTDKGQKTEGFFKRSLFTANAQKTRNAAKGSGVLSFGLTRKVVWCWFPEGQELVMFNKNGSNLRTFGTGLPASPYLNLKTTGISVALLTESEALVASSGFASTKDRVVYPHLFRWTHPSSQWERLSQPDVETSNTRLIGKDDDDLLLFAPYQGQMFIRAQSMK
jgi:hypothetical protein